MTRVIKGATDAHAQQLINDGRIVCDPDTGVILVDGKPRGYTVKGGYQRLYADGVNMQAHRVVWLFVHGSIPAGHVINHRDGNKHNNRIANLEAVSHRQNVLHGIRHNDYQGTYPGDEVDPDIAAAVAQHAGRALSRAEVRALLGEDEDDQPETLAALMCEPAWESANPTRPRRLA